jgi:hypothetical protein
MSPTVSPPPLGNHGSAYDSESDKTIIFAGRSCRSCPGLAETWAYDFKENSWTNLSPEVHPSNRVTGKMVYNSRVDRVMFFGGREFDGHSLLMYYGDTWTYEYNTNTWTEMNSPNPPPARFSHSLSYDSESDMVVMFGGNLITTSLPCFETWAYHYQPNIPSVPLNLQATEIDNEVNLTWITSLTDAGSPITEYNIYRGNGSNSLIFYGTVLGAEATSFQDSEVNRGSTYFYTVRAKNGVGESKDSNVALITIPGSSGFPGFSLVLMCAIFAYLVILRRRSN